MNDCDERDAELEETIQQWRKSGKERQFNEMLDWNREEDSDDEINACPTAIQ